MENSKIILYRGGQGEYVEKKSRFIADIFPVGSEEEALQKVDEIKKRHYDARHHCFAYVLDEKTERYSDDGEPSGTAGRPILDVLKGEGLSHVVAVVTRYFGGTLLGTGGLVRSYSSAVKEGLKQCIKLEQYLGYKLCVKTNYNDMGKLQYLARNDDLAEMDIVYAEDVEMTFLVPVDSIGRIEKEMLEKTAGKASLERQEKVWFGRAGGEVVLGTEHHSSGGLR